MPQHMLRLEVVNGPQKGQVVFVPDCGALVVGRMPECGIVIPQDLTVSRQHFRIEFSSQFGRLVHLSQTGETLVNGNPISNVQLQDGDEIAFGAGNKVRVTIEDIHDGHGALTAPIPADRKSVNSSNGFKTSSVSSGWNCYESADELLGFEKLLEILNDSQRVNAVFDFRRIGQPVPSKLVEPQYLFCWMSPESRDQFSPILISIPDNPDIAQVIASGWGKDGIVCFGSDLSDNELAAHWRKAIGVRKDEPGDAMTAYFWPSILNMILTCQSSEQVAPLLSGLSWLFTESPKSPGNWRLYTKADFVPRLTKAGLVAISEPEKSK